VRLGCSMATASTTTRKEGACGAFLQTQVLFWHINLLTATDPRVRRESAAVCPLSPPIVVSHGFTGCARCIHQWHSGGSKACVCALPYVRSSWAPPVCVARDDGSSPHDSPPPKPQYF